MLGPSGASDLEVPILASEHQSGIIVLLGGVDISTRLEQCASDLLKAKVRVSSESRFRVGYKVWQLRFRQGN